MNYLSLFLWLLIINKFECYPSFRKISHGVSHATQLSNMAFSCSFQRITGTDCSIDRLDKSKSLEIVALRNCSKDISNHCSNWSFSGVTTESELILARVGILGRVGRVPNVMAFRSLGLTFRSHREGRALAIARQPL